VIMLTQPTYIFLWNNPLLIIHKETNSKVLDDIKVSLQSDNPPLKLPFELLEVCFHFQKLLRYGSHVSASSSNYSPIMWIISLARGG